MASDIQFTLAGRPTRSDGGVTDALRSAARETGVDFEYLLKTAQRESSLNPQLTANTSSATGLFQFIEQTWLATLKNEGPALGFAREASLITRGDDGRYHVAGQRDRDAVLNLRKDPQAAATLAAALTRNNAAYLTQQTGAQPTDGELYIAHFLGPKGAVDLINGVSANPLLPADDIFPQAAEANAAIFYGKDGTARTLEEVYQVLVSRHQTASAPSTSAPDPERSFAVPPTDGASRANAGLAHGAEAAFLAGHFAKSQTHFSLNAPSGGGQFSPVLDKSNTSSQVAPTLPQNAGRGADGSPVDEFGYAPGEPIPSRYGRLQDVANPTPPSVEESSTPPSLSSGFAASDKSDGTASHTALPLSREGETAAHPRPKPVSDIGPPLELERFMRAYRAR